MSISLICACKNRYNALIVSLNSWLQFREITEVIIVDWSSDDPIDHITKIDPRIKVITVPNKQYFNQPQPLNLAASIATGDYILKVDSDYILNPYYDFIGKYLPKENSFTSGRISYTSPEYYNPEVGAYVIDKDNMSLDDLDIYFNTYSPFYKYLTGLLFVKKEYYNKIGGYNETLNSCYAYEDGEICDRLKLFGLNEDNIDYDTHIIHIPHPNKKRTENFVGFPDQENYEAMVRANLEQAYSGDQLEWQLEYAIAQKHIEHNKNTVGEIKEYYTKPKTKWNITQKDSQNYVAIELDDDNKLSGFPSVYYVSLEECKDRRDDLENQFEKYNIKPNAIISKRYSESNDIVTGKYVNTLNDGTKGCCVSHLKAIKRWYEETNEDYGFFCEDDLSLETVEHWDFTWKEFVDSIPSEIECVQLFSIRKEYDTFEMRPRHWDDWGATAYIIKRRYAEKIINTFIQGETFNLEIPNNDVMPLIETILFSSVGESYTFPIFVENTKFDSTFVGSDDDVKNGQKTNHRIAKDLILNYWKNKNNSVMIEKTVLENLLMDYSLDTENPENNFNLGMWYETEGHTAPALSYYLRCAERASESNPDLAYEALIRGSFCYEKQGTRDGSSRSLLFQAQAFRTDRPEAYFLLSAFAQKREWWQDCYINADLALRYCNFDCAPLKTDVRYPGKFGLLYQKAIGGWWWGKVSESRSLLTDILNNYDLNEVDYKFISDNLKNIGGDVPQTQEGNKFDYPESFDWSELTYEDKITIEREIVHEQVYRFWRDVKENDVVVDIGASVGAYCISILDQKPKTVYCVEPSKKLLKSLLKNCSEKIFDFDENPLVLVNKAIVENQQDKVNIFGGDEEYSTITFKDLINKNSIDHINFMKIDCEGGEYNIFNEDNIDFLLNNVDFIAMETHLNYSGCRDKFKLFRDKYLTKFKNYKVMSCTRQNMSWGESLDIKDKIFDDEFIENYTCEFMIYICNR